MDEVVLEDIFEIGERLLDEGADPSAVALLRDFLEVFHERNGFFPHITVNTSSSPYIELSYRIENYYWDRVNILPVGRKNRIVGWCTYKSKRDDGEVYYEPAEYWYKDMKDYVEKTTRRRNLRRK